jgi:hypothetical protein
MQDLTRKDVHRLGIEHAKKYGGIFWTQIAHMHVLLVSDPQLVAEVLDRTKTPHSVDKPAEPQFYGMLDEVLYRPASHILAMLSCPTAV